MFDHIYIIKKIKINLKKYINIYTNNVICIISWYRTDNKFSSFVRQLNFYGFRKVKAHVSAVDDADAKWWEFKVGFYLYTSL